MDKTGFLKELKKHLAVLNEGEQKDILDEYAQHIDMKMEKGMSEAEAIKDFGPLEKLAAEILEAYHVNPQFGAGKRIKLASLEDIPRPNISEAGTRFREKGGRVLKRLLTSITLCCVGIGSIITKPFRFAKDKWEAWRDKTGQEKQMMDQYETERVSTWREVPRKVNHSIKKMLIGILYITCWCIRWTWNLCMLFMVFLTGIFMLGCLYTFGVMVVLLIQGYPLVGLVVACLGAILCTGAITLFAIGLLRFKKPQSREAEVVQIEEVAEHA